MTRLIKLSARNVLRNTRRSALTVMVIVVSFVVLSVFQGYINSIRTTWGEMLIHNDYGHLQIFNRDYFKEDEGSFNYSISAQEYQRIAGILRQYQEVKFFSPRVNLSGLIGKENGSRIFLGSARDPSEQEKLYYFDLAYKGQGLSNERPGGIIIGYKLAEKLKVKIGDNTLVLAQSSLGNMEAINATIVGLAKTRSQLDSMIVYLSLKDAQELLLSKDCHSIVVLLDSTPNMKMMVDKLNMEFKQSKLPFQAASFYENAKFFTQIISMYNNYFNVSLAILSILIIFSLANTIYMSITDRLKEFSTMKAIGVLRRQIFLLIVFEGLMLALAGVIIGLVVSYFSHEAINSLKLTLPPPPGSDERIPFNVLFELGVNIKICLFSLAMAVIASIVPALTVVRTGILKGLSNY